jgi:hypothetical protein
MTGNALGEKKEITHAGAITAVLFSPDGRLLAVADAARKVGISPD